LLDQDYRHGEELTQIGELYKGKLRAKEIEIAHLYEKYQDRQAIDGEKLATVKTKLANAEKSVYHKIETEY
jgi:hypothetical protein